jgi:hypothetical protein
VDQNIVFNVSGLNCDAEGCDYTDPTVLVTDYPKWVNAPCPKCGANLLTQEDFEAVQVLIQLADAINELPIDKSGPIVEGTINMNGTGSLDFKIKDKEEEV